MNLELCLSKVSSLEIILKFLTKSNTELGIFYS